MRVLLGPVFPTPITEDTVMTVARRNLTDKKDMDALAEFLYSIPNCSYNQFVNLTALLNFIINGEMFDIAEQFREESSDVGNKLAVTYTEDLYKSQDEQVLHGTYQFENMLLSFVRDGETDKLNAFLTSTAKTTHLREGKLAEAPLRQAKNLLIGVAPWSARSALSAADSELKRLIALSICISRSVKRPPQQRRLKCCSTTCFLISRTGLHK